jgi:hypothetical protein
VKPSTAKFISYDLRPAKQAERRILLDFLKCANEAGITISDCRYVGMCGTMFYDFHLMHRFLGVNQMISLERDHNTFPRSKFNCPFDFIAVQKGTVAEFLAADRADATTIYWLDYDDGVGPDIVADIISLGTRVKIGGFAFVTVYAEPPGSLEKQDKDQRLEYFQENLGDFSVGLTVDDMGDLAFPGTVHRILVAAFKNAFCCANGRTISDAISDSIQRHLSNGYCRRMLLSGCRRSRYPPARADRPAISAKKAAV